MVGIESLGGGTAFADTFYGNDGTNLMMANLGDLLYGFGGDDSFYTTSAAGIVDGGDGIGQAFEADVRGLKEAHDVAVAHHQLVDVGSGGGLEETLRGEAKAAGAVVDVELVGALGGIDRLARSLHILRQPGHEQALLYAFGADRQMQQKPAKVIAKPTDEAFVRVAVVGPKAVTFVAGPEDETLLAGLPDLGIIRSSDGGRTWDTTTWSTDEEVG